MANCYVCLHHALPEIDRELANHPVRLVALDRDIPLNLLWDHAKNHTSEPAPAFPEVPAQTHVQQLLASALPSSLNPVQTLYSRPQSQSLPALTRLLALSSKLPASPEAHGFNEKAWWETRAKLVAALQRFPDALDAVNKALDDSPKMF